MANYQIIKDKEELQRFIDWLPEEVDGEKHMISLFARKKYDSTGVCKNDKSQLKRLTASKSQLINKIQKLEVELGSYELNGLPIPQEALALYITPNPRLMHKAGIRTLRELATLLEEGKQIYNPEAIALNAIQQTGKKIYFDIDIDVYNPLESVKDDVYKYILAEYFVNKEALSIFRTRGGFHLLVELSKIQNPKTWYQKAVAMKNEMFDVMMNSDGFLPCPGCTQGNYTPKMIL